MQVRDRVKQTAVYVSASSFNLAGGAAADGHVDFATAYGFSGMSTGNWTWPALPILIERENGEWQIMSAQLNRDDAPVVQTLTDAVFYSSSTGAALAFTASEEVTISLVPSAYFLNALAVAMLAPPAGDQHRNSGAYFPAVFGGALLAVGQGAQANGPDAIAIGNSAGAQGDGAVCIGNGSVLLDYGATIAGYNAFTNSVGGLASGLCDIPFFSDAMNNWLTWEQGVMNQYTADATPKNMAVVLDGATNHVPQNLDATDTIYADAGISRIKGTVTAISAAGDMKIWDIDYIIRTTLDYATTEVLGTPVKTVVHADAGAAAWDIDLVPNSATNEWSAEVTGAAATNIVWGFTYKAHYNTVYVP